MRNIPRSLRAIIVPITRTHRSSFLFSFMRFSKVFSGKILGEITTPANMFKDREFLRLTIVKFYKIIKKVLYRITKKKAI